MPTTRGLNFFLEDRNFQFLCESVMGTGRLRARPAAPDRPRRDRGRTSSTRWPPTPIAIRRCCAPGTSAGRRVDEVVRHPAYRRMEEIAFCRFGLAAMAHRPGVLGWPGRAPAGGQVRALLSLRPERVRAALPGQHDGLVRAHARRVRQRGAQGALPAAPHHHRLRRALAGHAVDDRAHRRLRRGRLHHGGPARTRTGSGGSGATSGSPRWPTRSSR